MTTGFEPTDADLLGLFPPGSRVADGIALPDPAVGDLLAVPATGAY